MSAPSPARAASGGPRAVDDATRLDKLQALLRCFTCVVNGLGIHFSPATGGPLTRTWIEDVFQRLARCLAAVDVQTASVPFLHQANSCMVVLCECLRAHSANYVTEVVSFYLKQVRPSCPCRNDRKLGPTARQSLSETPHAIRTQYPHIPSINSPPTRENISRSPLS